MAQTFTFDINEARRVGEKEEEGLHQTNPASPQQATLATADPGFDLPNARMVENDDTTGIGEAAGSIVASIPELLGGPGKQIGKKGLDLAAKVAPKLVPDALRKGVHHGSAETLIGTGAVVGDSLERALMKRQEGDIPLSDRILQDAGDTFKQSLGFGTAFRGIGGGLNKISYRPQIFQSPEVNLAYDTFNAAMARRGFPPLTLDAATKSTVLDVMGNVARSGMGGGKMVKFEDAAIEAANEMFEIMQKQIGVTENPDDLARVLYEVITQKELYSDAPRAMVRNRIVSRALDGKLAVNEQPIRNLIEKNLEEIDAIGGFGASVAGISTAKRLLGMTDSPTLSNMVKIAEMAGATKRRLLADPVKAATPAAGLMKQIEFQANQSIRQALKGYDKLVGGGTGTKASLAEAWNANQTLWGKHYERFYNDTINKIKKKIGTGKGAIPADVMSLLVKPETDGSLQFVKALKNALDDPQEWEQIGRQFVDSLRLAARDPKTKRFDGGKLFALLTNAKDSASAIGERTLETVFGKDMHRNLLEFGQALMTQQSKNPTSAGNVATTLAQGGAVVGAGGTAIEGNLGKASRILVMIPAVPWLFARVMTSPTFVKMATKGLKATPGSPADLAIYARLVNLISVANLREKHEAGPPEQQTTTRTAPRRSDATRGPAFVR